MPTRETFHDRAVASPEQRLLAWCARAHVDVSAAEAIRQALRREVDWPNFMRVAQGHQVLSLAGSTLCERFADDCPADIIGLLRSALRGTAARGLAAIRHLGGVLDILEDAAIPVIPYKGPLLSAMAYGNSATRDYGDLDVWVHPWDDHFRVAALLDAHGWRQFADYGYQRSFEDSDGEVVLDVHRMLTRPQHLPFALRFEHALERCVPVDLGGRTVQTLSPVDLLIVLCVQLAKDVGEWQHGVPLIKVCDIAALVSQRPAIDWDKVWQVARRLGVLGVVRVGLAVAQKLAGATIPIEMQVAGGRNHNLDSLVWHVEQRIWDDEHQVYSRPELLDPAAWNAAVRERLRDRNPALVALTQFAFVPNAYDYAFVRLPRRLHSFYGLVRPVRIAWKYGRPWRAGRSDETSSR